MGKHQRTEETTIRKKKNHAIARNKDSYDRMYVCYSTSSCYCCRSISLASLLVGNTGYNNNLRKNKKGKVLSRSLDLLLQENNEKIQNTLVQKYIYSKKKL